MPANLPPNYFEAEKRYRAAKAPGEKLAALEDMLRIMPKHKGTDHLQADLKSRIAKLKREPAKKGPSRGPSFIIPAEGAGQVALVGPANCGKSSLVALLTKAQPEVADYPHTTLKPTPGMMAFEDITFQLLDLPPVSEDYNEPWLWENIKRADLVWVVLSGASPLSQLEKTQAILADNKIGLLRALTEPQADLEAGWNYLEALLVITGLDLPDTAEHIDIFKELIEAKMKRARVWGSGAFEGQIVQQGHVLADKDVVEISF